MEQETFEEIKKSGRDDVPPAPFGFMADPWVELKSKYKDGDEFYFYSSDPESWSVLCGHEGYILIRGDEVVGEIITMMN